jgi:hypothetical protein
VSVPHSRIVHVPVVKFNGLLAYAALDGFGLYIFGVLVLLELLFPLVLCSSPLASAALGGFGLYILNVLVLLELSFSLTLLCSPPATARTNFIFAAAVFNAQALRSEWRRARRVLCVVRVGTGRRIGECGKPTLADQRVVTDSATDRGPVGANGINNNRRTSKPATVQCVGLGGWFCYVVALTGDAVVVCWLHSG